MALAQSLRPAVVIVRVVVCLVLLGGAIGKLLDPRPFWAFLVAVLGGGVAEEVFVVTLAVGALLGVGLLVYWKRAWPGWGAAGLFLLLTGLFVRGMALNLQEPVGWFGSLLAGQPLGFALPVRSLALAVMAGLVAVKEPAERRRQEAPQPS